VNALERPETSEELKVRLAEAVAMFGDTTASGNAGERLISLAQNESGQFNNSERAVMALVSLLDTGLAPIAAPVLVSNLLNPSSRHHFWLAWRIIGKAEKEPNNLWSAVFLSIILFSDREDDQRLKLWSAQVLTKHSKPHLRDLGLMTLWDMTRSRDSHSWVYAARWLVEHGPSELANKARKALFDEATNQGSDERRVVTAELLEMGAIDPLGKPIQNVIHETVLRELEEYGRKYGSRLHVSVPGVPKENVDLELFADNPAAVIKQFLSQDPVFWGDPKQQNLSDPQSINTYSYSTDNPITKKDPSGRCFEDGCFVEAVATFGFVGGIGAQAFHDYSTGDFSRRSFGQNVATYSAAGVGGAVVAGGTAIAGAETVGLGLLARLGITGLTAGTLTAGTEVGNSYVLGQPIDRGGVAVDSTVNALSAGALTLFPAVPGALPRALRSALDVFSKAHAARSGAEALFGTGLQILGSTGYQSYQSVRRGSGANFGSGGGTGYVYSSGLLPRSGNSTGVDRSGAPTYCWGVCAK
jgi:hypothetical protein